MDRRKSFLNISVAIIFKIILVFSVIFVKRTLISICGNETNGLNALYLSIVGFLSVVELGVGSAITFCMYKPIVEGDNEKVSALYCLFQRIYPIIGAVIFVLGLLITPFIHLFVKDYADIDVNLYIAFLLMLISVVLTYFFSAKLALIDAYKNNFITTSINSGGLLLQYLLQIVVLYLTKSFIWYLVCRIVSTIVQWIVTDIITKNRYNHIITKKVKLDYRDKKNILKNIKAMFMHRTGDLVINRIDDIVISMFLGVAILGRFSNYLTICLSLVGIIRLIFTSLTSVLGHLYVEEDNDCARKYCDAFHLINFIVGVIFFLGYYAIIDNLIVILFSTDLVMEKSISFAIAFNWFVQFLRESTLTFRDATGTFYNDRWKSLISAVLNLVLSVALVKPMGIIGVIFATIIVNLFISHIVEPFVLYKNAFSHSPKKYFITNYFMIIIFFIAMICMHFLMQEHKNVWLELLINGSISVFISIVTCLIVILFNKSTFKDLLKLLKVK